MPRKKKTESEKKAEMLAKKEAEFDSNLEHLSTSEKILDEIERLDDLFQNIDEDKKRLVQSMIKDVAFMAVTMDELRIRIAVEGTTIEYKNGENQYGTKQSPDAQLYLQLSQKHTTAMKVLIDLLPKTEKSVEKDDGFDSFVMNRGNK